MIKGHPGDTFCLDFQQAMDKFSYQRTFKNLFKKLCNHSRRRKALPWIKKRLKSRWDRYMIDFQKAGSQQLRPTETYGRTHKC